jgi:hypothetical protein
VTVGPFVEVHVHSDKLLELLEQVAAGSVTPEEGIGALADLPFADIGEARVDHHRQLRCGFPEVVFCQGKTPGQVRSVARELLEKGDVLLATRATPAHFQAVAQVDSDARYFEAARVIVVDRRRTRPSDGHVIVATAGTADTPVAEEAAISAEVMGCKVTRLQDVGVAGLHRLLAHRELLDSASVVIAIAGMEGALPSLVAGLIGAPVIAVPTSVGYGAHFGGVAPLLTMLNSCAGGIAVVNIDNGFGAAAMAQRIVAGQVAAAARAGADVGDADEAAEETAS